MSDDVNKEVGVEFEKNKVEAGESSSVSDIQDGTGVRDDIKNIVDNDEVKYSKLSKEQTRVMNNLSKLIKAQIDNIDADKNYDDYDHTIFENVLEMIRTNKEGEEESKDPMEKIRNSNLSEEQITRAKILKKLMLQQKHQAKFDEFKSSTVAYDNVIKAIREYEPTEKEQKEFLEHKIEEFFQDEGEIKDPNTYIEILEMINSLESKDIVNELNKLLEKKIENIDADKNYDDYDHTIFENVLEMIRTNKEGEEESK